MFFVFYHNTNLKSIESHHKSGENIIQMIFLTNPKLMKLNQFKSNLNINYKNE